MTSFMMSFFYAIKKYENGVVKNDGKWKFVRSKNAEEFWN